MSYQSVTPVHSELHLLSLRTTSSNHDMLFQSQKGNTAHNIYLEQSDLTALTCARAVAKSVRPVHPCFSFSI